MGDVTTFIAGAAALILWVSSTLEIFSGRRGVDLILRVLAIAMVGLMLLDAPTVFEVFLENGRRASAEIIEWFIPAIEDLGTPPTTQP